MNSTSLDLAKLFKAASKTLAANQADLNQADDYNHNHGDNMVDIFNMITKAMTAKKTASPSAQLEYASQVLAKKGTSGSAAAYSEGLNRAAQQFQGRPVTAENAVELISALMGSGAAQQPAGGSTADLIGSLLGGSAQPQAGGSTTDMLGSLIGGLMGGGQEAGSQAQPQAASDGIDAGDLLNIGMQLFQAYQSSSGKTSGQGGNLAGSLLDTMLSGSAMGSSSHRTQSGKLVADALLSAAVKYLGSRKQ